MKLPRIFALAAAAPILLSASRARASDPAAAQALFDEGRQFLAQGRFGEACPKFEESQRLDPGLGTQFHLADCWQRMGRKASAWALFGEVATAAHARGQIARARVAHDRAEALAPWVSKLAIQPRDASTVAGFTLLRDGAEVDRTAWGVPVPVDPGTHLIAAMAPAKQPWIFEVDVAPDQTILTVDVPPLADVPAPTPLPVARLVPPPAVRLQSHARLGVTEVMPEEHLTTDHAGDAQRAIGWTLAGLGLSGVAAGTYFGVEWLDDRDRIDSRCTMVCDSSVPGLRDSEHTNGAAAAGFLGGGAVTLIVGAALVAAAPQPRTVRSGVAFDQSGGPDARSGPRPQAATVHVAPAAGPGGGGLVVLGTW
jgi:hypothetical protein